MATVGQKHLTMLDLTKRLDPGGKIADIGELLTQMNPILEDIPWIEANGATHHRSVQRTGLPAVFWRMINQGVPTSKSRTAQIDDPMGMLDAYSEVDKKLAELSGDINAFRLSEAQPFMESITQELTSTILYGNQTADPTKFNGLSPRYSSLVTATAETAKNVINGGGVGSDNTSIWLVVWSPSTVFGIYPKGTKAGISHEDLGLETVENAGGVAGNLMRAYRDHWEWNGGVSVKDWRYAVRVANIDVSDLTGVSAADIRELMIKAIHRIPNIAKGKPVFYVNRTIMEFLDTQGRTDVISGGGMTFENVDGKPVYQFRGIQLRIMDRLLETEQRVI